MGLAPIVPAEWIDAGDGRPAQLAEKARLLTGGRREQVLASLPGSDAASREVFQLLVDNLRKYQPEFLGGVAPEEQNGRLPSAEPDQAPLERASRLVQEDFCVLQSDGAGTYRLTAGCVCFPSNWNLREKLGRPLGDIHAPVPGFATALAAPVDRFFHRLAVGQLVARLNWLVHDRPDLFQLGPNPDPPVVTAENAGSSLWLRLERQVLQRLPESGAVLFTIRTRVHRLRDAIRTPAKAAELAGALRSMPPDLQSYRHMAPFASPLLAWLDEEASRVRQR